ncbi:E4 ORF3 [Mastadenovirus eidoli]|uniref:E4 ORF3 n=1 Tax=Eidolon helvum adenovirus TaxID=2039267 RepID=A0A348FKI0_9ADEN|nr:E4 ORF3 [Eidolon helvum adenovirus]BBF72847.1 E4 ORF3 [Eidolon helvum adenovirus]
MFLASDQLALKHILEVMSECDEVLEEMDTLNMKVTDFNLIRVDVLNVKIKMIQFFNLKLKDVTSEKLEEIKVEMSNWNKIYNAGKEFVSRMVIQHGFRKMQNPSPPPAPPAKKLKQSDSDEGTVRRVNFSLIHP